MESLNCQIQRIGVHFRDSWELLKFLSKGVSDQIIITVGKFTLVVKCIGDRVNRGRKII